jgi:hypothetical protein
MNDPNPSRHAHPTKPLSDYSIGTREAQRFCEPRLTDSPWKPRSIRGASASHATALRRLWHGVAGHHSALHVSEHTLHPAARTRRVGPRRHERPVRLHRHDSSVATNEQPSARSNRHAAAKVVADPFLATHAPSSPDERRQSRGRSGTSPDTQQHRRDDFSAPANRSGHSSRLFQRLRPPPPPPPNGLAIASQNRSQRRWRPRRKRGEQPPHQSPESHGTCLPTRRSACRRRPSIGSAGFRPRTPRSWPRPTENRRKPPASRLPRALAKRPHTRAFRPPNPGDRKSWCPRFESGSCHLQGRNPAWLSSAGRGVWERPR